MSQNQFEKYHKAVRFLESFNNIPSRQQIASADNFFFVDRMRYFLNLIGNPDTGLKIIHVTGTAGKGTVSSMLHDVLMAAGERVGLYTSPFTTASIEKAIVNGKYISPNEFADTINFLRPALDKCAAESPYGVPSVFDIFLAVAFLHFKKQKCKWVIIEVGMGGLHDHTNVVRNPKITVITNIGYDHMEFLGRTLKKIAADKAGIIKKGSEFFTTERRRNLMAIFKSRCAEKDARFNLIAARENFTESNGELVRAIARYLKISESAIERGIKSAWMPARFETMQERPRVIIDGAHNDIKMESTAYAVKKLQYRKLHLIIGIANSKDSDAIMRHIFPVADYVYATRFSMAFRKAADPGLMLAKNRKYLKKGARASVFLDPKTALAQALKQAEPSDLVLVTGSFFLAGELRQLWYPEEFILKNRRSR